ncbi:YqjF family protein [Paenibacillus tuaregi]|uniref:YqjF family protein n=1 Tax=Paenibacillus tuaregi TaxID=1816681 RepID=UPI0009EF2CE2|nr:DUF2071 domain-containing protein [Paenibacillus tuaregi]
MNPHQILQHTRHRPVPMPRGPWLMRQTWRDLLFTHWPVDEQEIAPYIPQGLILDKWEGRPWVSVSPFRVDPLRLRGLPPIPFVHEFLEVNVRTYVVHDNKPGVLFLTLEASSRLAVAGARIGARLPYHHADMHSRGQEDNMIEYSSRRTLKSNEEALFQGMYKAAETSSFHASPGTLTHWLTERYCLYTSSPKHELFRGDIHHLPWPLYPAVLDLQANTIIQSFGLHHDPKPALQTYTPRLDVLLWPLKKV